MRIKITRANDNAHFLSIFCHTLWYIIQNKITCTIKLLCLQEQPHSEHPQKGIKKMKKRLSLVLAMILSVSMLWGCSGAPDAKADVKHVKAGETISPESKWINSTIDGALAADTPVDRKDDFYSAVNKDWLLSQTLNEGEDSISFLTQAEDVLLEKKLAIIQGAASVAGENPADIPPAQLQHDEALLQRFAALSSNWGERDALGVEPLRPYVEAIEGIETLSDMTDYLLNKDGTNFSFLFPVKISVGSTFTDHDMNTVIIEPTDNYTLDSADSYTNISDGGKLRMQMSDASVRLLLGRLGYPAAKINAIIKDCYRYETRLAKAAQLLSAANNIESYIKETDNRYDLAGLQSIQGDFPLTDILARYGYGNSQSYSVPYPKFVSGVGLLYAPRYLDELKAYCMVHTLNDAMPLLDRATFDQLQKMKGLVEEKVKPKEGDVPEPFPQDENTPTPAEREAKILLEKFIGVYLNEPLDQVYVARYCTAEQKTRIKALIQNTIDCYRDMLYAEDWLSVQAREKAVEKLDNLKVRAVYPDVFSDYSGLDLSGCGNLVDAVAAINAFELTRRAEKIDTPVSPNDWDVRIFPITWVNAAYMPTDNSINIVAGIMANDFVFNVEDTQEETLAKIGTIIGHEITHGFDTKGYLFDKDGYYLNWWTAEDEQTFQLRASRLAKYFSGIIPYPGATSYDGEHVKGEAIADMGGMKCMLGIAEKIPDFDYVLFFETYASLWREKSTYSAEAAAADDEHPLHFLRVNAVLQQFEKFYETFDIQKGDGMYLAPEERVAVW